MAILSKWLIYVLIIYLLLNITFLYTDSIFEGHYIYKNYTKYIIGIMAYNMKIWFNDYTTYSLLLQMC